jgi:hypothetical protein
VAGSIYGIGLHVKHVNKVTNAESELFLRTFWTLSQIITIYKCGGDGNQTPALSGTIDRYHPCENRIDNQTQHAATLDYDDKYERLGIKVAGSGEVPFYHPVASDDDRTGELIKDR